MELKVVGSGSSGNCYILEGETSALVIEAGVRPKEVMEAINFDTSKIAGVLVTHCHLDHCKYVNNLSNNYGLKIYAGPDVLEKTKFFGTDQILSHGSQIMIGEFKVMPFSVEHDVDCFGFLIRHPEMGTTAFITDTHYIKYKLPGIDHLMIECNYDQDILDENVLEDRLDPIVRKRVMKSHMSIDTVMDLLYANDISGLKNIVLLHLSSGNSDENAFRERIYHRTGKMPEIAFKGLKLNFGKVPF